MLGTIISTIAFLGASAVNEALKALQQAYASHPSAVADIRRLINQESYQKAAQAMEELAPKCATTVGSALKQAARHLRS